MVTAYKTFLGSEWACSRCSHGWPSEYLANKCCTDHAATYAVAAGNHKASAPHPPRPDHVEASIEALMRAANNLRSGQSPEDVGPSVILIGRMMARRT